MSTSAGHAPSSWPCPRAIRVSIRPKLTEELRSPGPRRESARKRTPYKDEGYAPFQDPFPTLWISQFASFAHFFCWIVLPRAPSTSMQVPGTFCQRLRFSIFAQPKRTCMTVELPLCIAVGRASGRGTRCRGGFRRAVLNEHSPRRGAKGTWHLAARPQGVGLISLLYRQDNQRW